MASTASREQRGKLDPTVETASGGGWQRWAARIAERERERLAGFGVVVLLGFLTGLFAVYSFAWLANEVLQQETTQMDANAAAFVRQGNSPAMDTAAWVMSLFGSELVLMFGIGLLALLGWQRRWGAAVLLVLVTAGAQLLNDALKTVFHRTRPEPVIGLIPAQSFSFPSGHAMVSASFYFFVAYLAWRLVHGSWRWVIAGGLLLLVLLIGVSRIYLQAHYLSDVIAGYVAGFLWTDAVMLASQFMNTRRRKPEP